MEVNKCCLVGLPDLDLGDYCGTFEERLKREYSLWLNNPPDFELRDSSLDLLCRLAVMNNIDLAISD